MAFNAKEGGDLAIMLLTSWLAVIPMPMQWPLAGPGSWAVRAAQG